MNPEYLSHDNTPFWQSVSDVINKQGHIILLLDYDGTLTPIRPTPDEAIISSEVKSLVQTLAYLKNVSVVIVTGRAHNDIFRLLELKNTVYISNHGLEIIDGSGRWVHPLMGAYRPELQMIFSLLIEKLNGVEGLRIEDKGYTITIHYRNIDPAEIPFIEKEIVHTLSGKNKFVLAAGKKIYEVKPDVSWHKGRAALEWLKNNQWLDENKPLIISLGDDLTDEDMFDVLNEIAFTIKVGTDFPTKAKYFLNDPGEVYQLLLKIYNLTQSNTHLE